MRPHTRETPDGGTRVTPVNWDAVFAWAAVIRLKQTAQDIHSETMFDAMMIVSRELEKVHPRAEA